MKTLVTTIYEIYLNINLLHQKVLHVDMDDSIFGLIIQLKYPNVLETLVL